MVEGLYLCTLWWFVCVGLVVPVAEYSFVTEEGWALEEVVVLGMVVQSPWAPRGMSLLSALNQGPAALKGLPEELYSRKGSVRQWFWS